MNLYICIVRNHLQKPLMDVLVDVIDGKEEHERAENFELVLQQHLLFVVSGWRGKGLVDLVNQLTLERCHSF